MHTVVNTTKTFSIEYTITASQRNIYNYMSYVILLCSSTLSPATVLHIIKHITIIYIIFSLTFTLKTRILYYKVHIHIFNNMR